MPKTTRTDDALDIAARYFVYKIYDATIEQRLQWHVLYGMGEKASTICRAVERGWIVLREGSSGNLLKRSAALTDEGRGLGRRARYGVNRKHAAERIMPWSGHTSRLVQP